MSDARPRTISVMIGRSLWSAPQRAGLAGVTGAVESRPRSEGTSRVKREANAPGGVRAQDHVEGAQAHVSGCFSLCVCARLLTLGLRRERAPSAGGVGGEVAEGGSSDDAEREAGGDRNARVARQGGEVGGGGHDDEGGVVVCVECARRAWARSRLGRVRSRLRSGRAGGGSSVSPSSDVLDGDAGRRRSRKDGGRQHNTRMTRRFAVSTQGLVHRWLREVPLNLAGKAPRAGAPDADARPGASMRGGDRARSRWLKPVSF